MTPGSSPNDCAPTAFTYVTGQPYAKVMEVCVKVGEWDADIGVNGSRFEAIATEFGLVLGELDFAWIRYDDGSHMETPLGRYRQQTIGQFIRTHPKGKFLVHTKDHVFAVIDGKNYDRARTGLKTHLIYFQEIKGADE